MTLRYAIVRALAFTAALASRANALEGEFSKDPDTGCKVVLEFHPNEIVDWTGRCVGGFASGTGVAHWRYQMGSRILEQTFQGEMARGFQTGKGFQRYSNGTEYVGDWRSGERHGFGRLKFADGVIHEGLWRGDKMHGRGVHISPNGERVAGVWRFNVFKGAWYPTSGRDCSVFWTPEPLGTDQLFGRLDWSGACEKRRADGEGVLVWTVGDQSDIRFEGHLNNGRLVRGRWTLTRLDADGRGERASYVGAYGDGAWRGEGEWRRMTSDFNGDMQLRFTESYIGGWRDSRRHGSGVYSSEEVDEKGPSMFLSYSGSWSDDVRHGYGEETKTLYAYALEGVTADDSKTVQMYAGQWRNDQESGRGSLNYVFSGVNGEDPRRLKYEGEWFAGELNGRGVFTFEDGGAFDGAWRAGSPTLGRCVFPKDSYEGACLWMSPRPNSEASCFVRAHDASDCLSTGQGNFR